MQPTEYMQDPRQFSALGGFTPFCSSPLKGGRVDQNDLSRKANAQ